MRTVRQTGRRRGAVLESVIAEAALAELTAHGYPGFSMERVAVRAGTGKASIYRRWPSRIELVVAAVQRSLPGDEPPDTGSLRGDLIEMMSLLSDLLAGPAGIAVRGIIAETLSSQGSLAEASPPLGFATSVMERIVQRAVARGELAPGSVTAQQLRVPPAMMRNHFLFRGPVTTAVIIEMVDEVVLKVLC